MPVGFIGLGLLGTAMARRLMERGEKLVVWNRTSAKAGPLGLAPAANPAEVARRTRVIILNLFDSGAVNEVLNGRDGVLAGVSDGTLVIDTTTNDYREVGKFHRQCAEKNVQYLEVPVLGSVGPASQGKLTVLASGTEEAFAAARPYLAHLGERMFYLAEPGTATRMKLVNNLVLGSFMAALAEATALGERCGIGREQVLDILGAGAGSSGVLTAKRGKLLAEDFSPQFAARTIDKDLRLVEALAAEAGLSLEAASMARRLLRSVIEDGLEEADFSVVYTAAGKSGTG